MTNLLMIPGLLCNAELFEAQRVALARSVECTVADHARAASMADIARQILAEAPATFALAGLSMGGYVAFEILRRAPERVERLALIDTSARPDLPEQTENRERLVGLARRKGITVPAREMYPKLVAPSRQNDIALRAVFTRMAEATGVDGFARQQGAIAGRPDSRPLLGAIACPTLVIVGDEDTLTPPDVAREMASAIPGARLGVVTGCGHLSSLEAPQAVSDLLRDWLRS